MNPLHPCGNLPVSGLTLSVWYCHHHQAYFAIRSRYTQTNDVDLVSDEYDRIEWGPFDTWDDVVDWTMCALPDQGLA